MKAFVQHALQACIMPSRAVLRCAVLCCAVLCCAVLCTIAHDLTCLGCTVALNLCAGCSKRRSVLPTPWNRWQRSQDHVKAWSQHAAHVPSPDTPQGTPPRRAAAGRYGLCPALPCGQSVSCSANDCPKEKHLQTCALICL